MGLKKGPGSLPLAFQKRICDQLDGCHLPSFGENYQTKPNPNPTPSRHNLQKDNHSLWTNKEKPPYPPGEPLR